MIPRTKQPAHSNLKLAVWLISFGGLFASIIWACIIQTPLGLVLAIVQMVICAVVMMKSYQYDPDVAFAMYQATGVDNCP
jgi:hypothetical protein